MNSQLSSNGFRHLVTDIVAIKLGTQFEPENIIHTIFSGHYFLLELDPVVFVLQGYKYAWP
jgi:hypothetical protein